MKVLSYNIYGVKDTEYPIPEWEIRQKNINRILNILLQDKEIKVCCFQEVNQYNIDLLNEKLKNNNFKILEKFPMKTEKYNQYNIIAIRDEQGIDLSHLFEADRERAVHGIHDEDKLFALAKGSHTPHQIAAATISRMNNKENLEWLAKNRSKGNIRPTVGQMAGMRLRGEIFYTPKFR